MDMHTDTTAHLAAEGAETPARATAAMGKALVQPMTGDELADGFGELLLAIERMDDAAINAFESGLTKLCPRHAEPAALAIWEKVAHDLDETSRSFDLHMSAEKIVDCEYEAGAAYNAALRAAQPRAKVIDQFHAQIAVERLALFAAETIYQSYAENPEELVALATRLGAIQKLSRSFSGDYDAPAPWLSSAAVAITFEDVRAADATRHRANAAIASLIAAE